MEYGVRSPRGEGVTSPNDILQLGILGALNGISPISPTSLSSPTYNQESWGPPPVVNSVIMVDYRMCAAARRSEHGKSAGMVLNVRRARIVPGERMRLGAAAEGAHGLSARGRILARRAWREAREVLEVGAEALARLAAQVGGLVPQLALPRLGAGDLAPVVVHPVGGRAARVEVGTDVVAHEAHVPAKGG